jgi:hypothetical protein
METEAMSKLEQAVKELRARAYKEIKFQEEMLAEGKAKFPNLPEAALPPMRHAIELEWQWLKTLDAVTSFEELGEYARRYCAERDRMIAQNDELIAATRARLRELGVSRTRH